MGGRDGYRRYMNTATELGADGGETGFNFSGVRLKWRCMRSKRIVVLAHGISTRSWTASCAIAAGCVGARRARESEVGEIPAGRVFAFR